MPASKDEGLDNIGFFEYNYMIMIHAIKPTKDNKNT